MAVTFGPRDSRGFLLPLLLAFAILSVAAQTFWRVRFAPTQKFLGNGFFWARETLSTR